MQAHRFLISFTNDSFSIPHFAQVKLYRKNSLACLGYLIDESWLIAPSECFATTTITNKSGLNINKNENESDDDGFALAKSLFDASDWTAEINYEHDEVEHDNNNNNNSNNKQQRRRVAEILVQGNSNDITMTPSASSQSGRQHDSGVLPSPIVLAKLGRPVRFRCVNYDNHLADA